MIDIDQLRRLAQAATPGPWKILPVGDGRQKFAVADSEFLSILTVTDEGGATFGTVYDDADAKFIAAANPATISELLDRLEAAESECLEESRLNGMGSEREAALMAKLEAAEKERNALRAELETERMRLAACGVVAFANTPDSAKQAREMRPEYWSASCGDVARMVDENIKLRAKIETMEKQEPVAFALYSGWARKAVYLSEIEACEQRDRRQLTADLGGSLEAYRVVPLYLAPGAKGEEK